jgi:hypothetical protein
MSPVLFQAIKKEKAPGLGGDPGPGVWCWAEGTLIFLSGLVQRAETLNFSGRVQQRALAVAQDRVVLAHLPRQPAQQRHGQSAEQRNTVRIKSLLGERIEQGRPPK